jgi:hypothetical protein
VYTTVYGETPPVMVVVKFAVPPVQIVEEPETASTEEDMEQPTHKAALDTTSISAVDKALL